MKAIMYHYVRTYEPGLPFFRYLEVDNFRKQLDYFEAKYGYVTYEEWCNFVENGVAPKDPGKIILTFDDAMRCHYDFVFPELLKRHLWGIFYVPTSPYVEHLVLDVHRIHLLCGAHSGIELIDVANSFIEEDMIPGEKINEFRDRTYTRQKNATGVSEFKRLMNYFIDYKHRNLVINQLVNHFGLLLQADQFYVPKNNLMKMKEQGMVIGSHSYSHPVMSRLTAAEQKSEIEKSLVVLGDLVEETHKTYCHPYGGFHSFNRETVYVLKQLKVSYAFNVESREIIQADYKRSKYHLPRFDCNLFPYGHAS